MAGIYIHIPFCRSKCRYCNFVSVASLKFKSLYISALIAEIKQQCFFFEENTQIGTIYLGGGTPSLLKKEETEKIINVIYENFNIKENAELTMEINPEDAEYEYLCNIKGIGFNRLSIGIQSFHDEELKYLGRKHTAKKGIEAVITSRNAGFNNISIDLIYGMPVAFAKNPQHNIKHIINLNPEHVSAYSLTIEPKTVMANMVSNGKLLPPDEKISGKQFLFYLKNLIKAGYEHYEISNYAKPGYRSIHNSSYWQEVPYLGLGAGAHSYNLKNRYSNTKNIIAYINECKKINIRRKTETLTMNDKYNEYVMMSLRTKEGANLSYIRKNFGDIYAKYYLQQIQKSIECKYVFVQNEIYYLTDEGKLWGDAVSRNLIRVS